MGEHPSLFSRVWVLFISFGYHQMAVLILEIVRNSQTPWNTSRDAHIQDWEILEQDTPTLSLDKQEL